MKHILWYIILAPTLLVGQKKTQWTTYKNLKQNYSLVIPVGTQIDSTKENIVFRLPENSALRSRSHELTLTIQNPINSCMDTIKPLLKNCGCLIESIKTIKLMNHTYLVSKTEKDAAMGGWRGNSTSYSTSRPSDKSCFIFYSEFNFSAGWDEKNQQFIEREDSYLSTEFKYIEKIIGSLKFTN